MHRPRSWTRSLLSWRQTWDLVCLMTMWGVVSALSTCAPATAGAEPPPGEELIVIPRRVLDTCEDDARRVDRLEPALRSCQRDLDATSGALDEARRTSGDIERDRRELVRRVAELEAERERRWSPLTWSAIGAGSALVIVLGVILAAQ